MSEFADSTDACLSDLLRRHARTQGGRAAVTADGHTISWSELDTRATAVAGALEAAGAVNGARVAVLDRNSAELIEVFHGAARAGAVTVPLNWRLSPPELAKVLRDADPTVVIVHHKLRTALPENLAATVVVIGDDRPHGYQQWIANAPAPDVDGAAPDLDEPVLQLYTSGTTDVPKGVLITQRNLNTTVRSSTGWGITTDARCLVAMPMFHIGGFSMAAIALHHGVHTIILRDSAPASLLETLHREQVTHTFLVPTMIDMLLDQPDIHSRDLSALRAIVYGASPITPALLRRTLDNLGCPLFGVYGLTETTGAITQLHPEDHDPGGTREHLLRSVGRPYPWVELRTVDVHTGEPTLACTAGEVVVRSGSVTPGYHQRPVDTATVIDCDGWLHTGDIGYLDDDGYLTINDRIKDMIITGGENVYPVEVEAVLAEHPSVAQVAVIGLPHPRWGEAVHAVVVPRPGATPNSKDIINFARSKLAGYKCPKEIDIVPELPTGPTGKILKRALRQARVCPGSG